MTNATRQQCIICQAPVLFEAYGGWFCSEVCLEQWEHDRELENIRRVQDQTREDGPRRYRVHSSE